MSAKVKVSAPKSGPAKGDVKKVVLAYSGGLDTSVILKWLQSTYTCEVVTFTADLGQGEELEPARKKQLQTVQRLWLQFRDANCDFYADPDGGTLARLGANECMMTLTAQRAQELEGFGPER